MKKWKENFSFPPRVSNLQPLSGLMKWCSLNHWANEVALYSKIFVQMDMRVKFCVIVGSNLALKIQLKWSLIFFFTPINSFLFFSLQLYHSEKSKNNVNFYEEDDELTKEIVNLFQTGQLRHDFNFRSVYYPLDSFASTFQDRWILVDYIFYTAAQNNRNSTKDKIPNTSLRLLSYLQLPTPGQCNEIGMIPNRFLGSDHLSLTAKFLLKSNQTFKVKGLL